MHTEITEYIKGWVLYDGDCALCRRWVERTRPLLLRRGFHYVPLQAAWVRARLGHAENGALTEMKLLAADGRILGGADAIVQSTRSIWWAWPFYAIAQLPGIKTTLRAIYRQLALIEALSWQSVSAAEATRQPFGTKKHYQRVL